MDSDQAKSSYLKTTTLSLILFSSFFIMDVIKLIKHTLETRDQDTRVISR